MSRMNTENESSYQLSTVLMQRRLRILYSYSNLNKLTFDWLLDFVTGLVVNNIALRDDAPSQTQKISTHTAILMTQIL